MDLLERIKEAVGCEYISDLCGESYNAEARKALLSIDPDGYSLSELSDAANYIFSRKTGFASPDEAKEFFCAEKNS